MLRDNDTFPTNDPTNDASAEKPVQPSPPVDYEGNVIPETCSDKLDRVTDIPNPDSDPDASGTSPQPKKVEKRIERWTISMPGSSKSTFRIYHIIHFNGTSCDF